MPILGPIYTIRLSHTIVHFDVSEPVVGVFRTNCNIRERIASWNQAYMTIAYAKVKNRMRQSYRVDRSLEKLGNPNINSFPTGSVFLYFTLVNAILGRMFPLMVIRGNILPRKNFNNHNERAHVDLNKPQHIMFRMPPHLKVSSLRQITPPVAFSGFQIKTLLSSKEFGRYEIRKNVGVSFTT